MLPLFSNIACTDLNLQTPPNWLEFLSAVDNSALVVDEDISREEKTKSLTNESFTVCHHFLNLLCSMPDINARSFSRLVTCIFNLERYTHLSVGCFLIVSFVCAYVQIKEEIVL